MQFLRAGTDSLYLTMKAVGSADLMTGLIDAKSRAAEERRDVSFEFGGIKGIVPPRGDGNGYPYVFNTGVLGGRFMFRQTKGQSEWDLLVKPHATALLALGFDRVVRSAFETLSAIDVRVIDTT